MEAGFSANINTLKPQRQKNSWININIKVESYLLSWENWCDLEAFSLLGKVRDRHKLLSQRSRDHFSTWSV